MHFISSDHVYAADGRGVGIIEVGVDAEGGTWVDMRLDKVVDTTGVLVRGDLYLEAEIDDRSPEQLARAAEAIYHANKDA